MFSSGQFVVETLALVLINVLVPEVEVPEVVIALAPVNVRFVALEVFKTVVAVPVKVMPLVLRLRVFVPDPAIISELQDNPDDGINVPEFNVQLPLVLMPGATTS